MYIVHHVHPVETPLAASQARWSMSLAVDQLGFRAKEEAHAQDLGSNRNCKTAYYRLGQSGVVRP